MIEVTMLVPLRDNSGNPFPARHHADFADYLTGVFGGCSAFPGVVAGQWAAAGAVYRDETVAYVVGVDGVLARAADLTAAVAYLKAHYGQLAVYVRYLGVAEVL